MALSLPLPGAISASASLKSPGPPEYESLFHQDRNVQLCGIRRDHRYAQIRRERRQGPRPGVECFERLSAASLPKIGMPRVTHKSSAALSQHGNCRIVSNFVADPREYRLDFPIF
jgi:hypothetical protein